MGLKKLNEKKWRSSFDCSGRIPQFDNLCKTIIEHGVEDSIRGEVWEILLGCYSTFQTFEEKEGIRNARRARYFELLEQCKSMNENLGSGKLPYSVNSKTLDIRKLSDSDRNGDAKLGFDRLTSLARLKMESMLPESPGIRLKPCSKEKGREQGEEDKGGNKVANDESDEMGCMEKESTENESLVEEINRLNIEADAGDGNYAQEMNKDDDQSSANELEEAMDMEEYVKEHFRHEIDMLMETNPVHDLQSMKSLSPLGSGDYEHEINAEALKRLKEKELDIVYSLKETFFSQGWFKHPKKHDRKNHIQHPNLKKLITSQSSGKNANEKFWKFSPKSLSASGKACEEGTERGNDISNGHGLQSSGRSSEEYVKSNGGRKCSPIPPKDLIHTKSLDSALGVVPETKVGLEASLTFHQGSYTRNKPPESHTPRSGSCSSEASPSGKKISSFFSSVLTRANSSGPELVSSERHPFSSLKIPKIFRSKSQDSENLKHADGFECSQMAGGDPSVSASPLNQSEECTVVYSSSSVFMDEESAEFDFHPCVKNDIKKSNNGAATGENSKLENGRPQSLFLRRSGSDNTELTCELHNLHKTHNRHSIHPVVALGMEATEERVANWLWTLHKIVVDVVRTDRNLPFFDETSNLARMCDILAVHAWVDPSTGFCQGMCDLLSPFLVIFPDDADAFWCFECLFSRLRHNFVLEGPVGVMRQLAALRTIVALTDPNLLDRLIEINADNFMFSFRMLLLLFRRELPFSDVLHLWEMMWAVDFASSDFSSLFHNAPQALNYASLFSPACHGQNQNQNQNSNSNADENENEIENELVFDSNCIADTYTTADDPYPYGDLPSPMAVPSWQCLKSFVKCKHPLHMNSHVLQNGFLNSNSGFSSTVSMHSSNPARPSLLLEWGELRDGDSNITVFLVAAILRQNRKKIMQEIEEMDDAIKMFNDVEFEIDISYCIRMAVRIRNTYLRKLIKVPRQLPFTNNG